MKNYWESWKRWPKQVFHIGGRNLRPSKFDYKKQALELNSILNFQKTDNVLDVGCGTGEVMRYIAPAVNGITGIDKDDKMINHAEEDLVDVQRVTLKVMNALDSEMPKSGFDKIFSMAVVQYVTMDNLFEYVNNLLKACKDGGKILIGDVINEGTHVNGEDLPEYSSIKIPKEYWSSTWPDYFVKTIKSKYEDRYHVLLSK